MGTGYTRNDTPNNIADGNVINASDLDGEFDAIQAAFNATTGHSHDGTSGEGPQITAAGIANDAVALGTKTTGNYVAAGAVSGVGLSGSASSEGATFTVTSNATSANTASTIVARDASGNFSAGNVTVGNLITAGNVDGRDVSADGAKLDGIEAGATADQTAAEIRTLVESATDSNVFTDADHSKLNGIESGATADQTASEILTLIKTVDGAGSGLDADTLDGVNSTQFLRSDATDTATQRIQFNANDTNNWDTIATATGSLGAIEIYNAGAGNDAFMAFHVGSDVAGYFGMDGGINDFAVGGWSYGANAYRIWHEGNHGAGSGLDADLLDGQQGSSYLRSDAADTKTAGDLSFADNVKANFGAGSDLQIYHNGSNSYIEDAGTGGLIFKSNIYSFRNSSDTEQVMLASENGAVSLYFDNASKLATTSYGIDISGSVVADTHSAGSITGVQTPNFSTYQNFVWTLTGNITLSNPTTEKTGQSGFFIFIHSGAGRTVSLGTDYETAGGAGLTLSSTAGAVDIVPYAVQSAGNILLGTPQLAFS